MEESAFHDRVTRADGVADPEPIASATLETLGEALSNRRAADLAEWLPDRYAETLRAASEEPASLGAEQFLEHVRERDGSIDPDADLDVVRERAAAVGDAVAETVPHDELLAVRSQLPSELDDVF